MLKECFTPKSFSKHYFEWPLHLWNDLFIIISFFIRYSHTSWFKWLCFFVIGWLKHVLKWPKKWLRNYVPCHDPSLRLATKAKAYNGAGQEWSPGVKFHVPRSVGGCEGMNPHTPNGLPLWELESQWTPKSS